MSNTPKITYTKTSANTYSVEADGHTIGTVGKAQTATRGYWWAEDTDGNPVHHPRFDQDGYAIDGSRKRVTKALVRHV